MGSIIPPFHPGLSIPLNELFPRKRRLVVVKNDLGYSSDLSGEVLEEKNGYRP